MAKKVTVILNDIYHFRETYEPIAKRLFSGPEWELTVQDYIRPVVEAAGKPDLLVNFTIGCGKPDNNDHLRPEEQQVLVRAVEAGMNALYVHASMAVVAEGSPMYSLTLGRFASHPKEHNPVYCTEIRGSNHPIMRGIEPFEAPDEHYFCTVDLDKATPFLATISIAGTEIGGWCQQKGKGRVVSLTPGPTTEMLDKMEPLLKNAIRWAMGET